MPTAPSDRRPPTVTARLATDEASPLGERVRPGVLLAIGAGGALGSVARYEIGLALPVSAGEFPWATWLVNVTGALALGLLATLVVERWPPTRYVRPFAGIGVCGGFTTWSTFMTDASLLVRDGHVALAVVYVVATVAGGLAATVAGVGLVRSWPILRKTVEVEIPVEMAEAVEYAGPDDG